MVATESEWVAAEFATSTNSWTAFTVEFRRLNITGYRWAGTDYRPGQRHPYLYKVEFKNAGLMVAAKVALDYEL